MAGRPAGWLAGWPVGWLAGWLAGWQATNWPRSGPVASGEPFCLPDAFQLHQEMWHRPQSRARDAARAVGNMSARLQWLSSCSRSRSHPIAGEIASSLLALFHSPQRTDSAANTRNTRLYIHTYTRTTHPHSTAAQLSSKREKK